MPRPNSLDSHTATKCLTEDALLRGDHVGGELRRLGSVRQACAILDHCDRGTIYELIKVQAVQASKHLPDRPNSHWRVDLLSVWEHKRRQIEM